RATQLEALATALWGPTVDHIASGGATGRPRSGDDGAERRRKATAGVFAAGAFARERGVADAPPLISSRVHMLFRGVPGLWAVMDPRCPKVPVVSGVSDVQSPSAGLSLNPPHHPLR